MTCIQKIDGFHGINRQNIEKCCYVTPVTDGQTDERRKVENRAVFCWTRNRNSPCIIWMESPHHRKSVDILPVLVVCGAKLHRHWPRLVWISRKYLDIMNSILTIFCILLLLAPASKMMHWEFGCNGRRIFSKRTLHSRIYVAIDGDDGDDEYFGKVNEINVWKQSLCVANFCAFASWS